MPATDATRLLLFAGGPHPAAPSTSAKVRRYRLARLRLDATARHHGEPRYAYLKRSYD